jgi:predicted PurR-regulated permease PerM
MISPVVTPLSTTAIVLIVTIFILLQREDLRDRLIRLFGSSDLNRTTVAMNDAARRLSRYFLTQLAINACFGAIIRIGLFFIGVPSPMLWGAGGTRRDGGACGAGGAATRDRDVGGRSCCAWRVN